MPLRVGGRGVGLSPGVEIRSAQSQGKAAIDAASDLNGARRFLGDRLADGVLTRPEKARRDRLSRLAAQRCAATLLCPTLHEPVPQLAADRWGTHGVRYH